MTPTREWGENVAKFEPWLNERTERSIPYEKLGLKNGAPPEAVLAYTKYIEERKRRREMGLR